MSKTIQDQMNEISEAISGCCNVDYEEDIDRIIVTNGSEYEWDGCYDMDAQIENRKTMKQAWSDFKEANSEIREAGYKSIYDENQPPEWDVPGWQLRIAPI